MSLPGSCFILLTAVAASSLTSLAVPQSPQATCFRDRENTNLGRLLILSGDDRVVILGRGPVAGEFFVGEASQQNAVDTAYDGAGVFPEFCSFYEPGVHEPVQLPVRPGHETVERHDVGDNYFSHGQVCQMQDKISFWAKS